MIIISLNKGMAMRYKLYLLMLITPLLPGCMTAVSSSASAVYNRYNLENTYNNQMLAWQAQQNINHNTQLKYETNINATSFDKMILLTGQAPTDNLREQAENAAKGVPNAKHVIDMVQITEPVSSFQQMQDSWLTTKVASQIITSGATDPDNVKVVTENNTVYLMGSLKRAQAQQVIDIAKNTDGVEKVVTLIYFLDPKTS